MFSLSFSKLLDHKVMLDCFNFLYFWIVQYNASVDDRVEKMAQVNFQTINLVILVYFFFVKTCIKSILKIQLYKAVILKEFIGWRAVLWVFLQT